MSTTSTYTVEILSFYLSIAEAKIKRLQGRAKKLGFEIPNYAVSEPYFVTRTQITIDPDSKQSIEEIVQCKAHLLTFDKDPSDLLVLNGWAFKGIVDRSEGVLLAHGATQEEFERSKLFDCDHCHAKRRRDRVYIVAKDGETKIIGSTCADSFIGSTSVLSAIHTHNDLKAIVLWGEWDEDHGKGHRYFDAIKFVELAAMVARVDGGYISKNQGAEYDTSTAAMVQRWLYGTTVRKYYGSPTEADEIAAAEAIEWAKTLDDSRSDFSGNIARIAKAEKVGESNSGMCCGLYASYLGHKRNQAERSQKNIKNEWIGTLKERREFGSGTITKLIPTTSEVFYGGRSAITEGHTVIIQLESGHILKWSSSSRLGEQFTEQTKVNITATIKAHGLYKELKQTVVTRANLTLALTPTGSP